MSKKHLPPRLIILAFVLVMVLAILACNGAVETTPELPQDTPINGNLNTAFPMTQPVFSLIEPSPTVQASTPAIQEDRRLVLDYPPRMKANVESDIVTLTLDVDEFGRITPTARVEGNVVRGESIQIPDLYDTHKVVAEARLEMAGMQVSPAGAIFEPMNRGQAVKFFWSIRPKETGYYQGTVWLHLNFEDKSTADKNRIAVSAQFIEVEAVDFFGLSVNFARTSGVIGSVVGGVIGFPFLEDILKYVFKRRRSK